VSNTYCACLCVHSGVQYILCLFVCVLWCPIHIVFVCLCIVVSNTYCDTTVHKQTNTICVGHHYAHTNKHNMCWTPLCTNKQTQYVLDTTIHKQTSTICVGHHYTQTNKHNMCWTPVSNTYCACLFVYSGVQHILCLFVCV
jgi:hypothetical protein